MCRLGSLILVSLSCLYAIGLVSGCAEAVGTGAPVAIPTVLVECTTPQCKASTNPLVFVWITTATCNWNLIDNATVVNSTTTTCDPTSGCRVVLPADWILGSNNQATSTLPSGYYTVCGRINNMRTLPQNVSPNDVTIEVSSVSFVERMGVLSLGGTASIGRWSDQ